MKKGQLLFFICFLFISSSVFSQENTGMKFGINVDQVFTSDFEKDDYIYSPREVELTFYGPVNHLFDALVSAACHEERGVFNFELHEAWISSSSLVKNFEFKLGQFFLNIGRLNKVHRHEWPFITGPRYHQKFFGDEAVSDSGIEVAYQIPSNLHFSITAGLGSGRTFGHSHSAGEKPDLPTNYLRFSHFFEAFNWNGFDIGLNYLNRINGEGDQTLFFGLDFIGKKKNGSTTQHLIQNEIWFRQSSYNAGDSDTREIGSYIYYQYGFTNGWSIGSRLDYYSDLTVEDIFGNKLEHYDIRGVLSLTYQPTEFMRFKLDYSYGIEKQDGKELQQTNMLEFQVTFLLGAHPSHEF